MAETLNTFGDPIDESLMADDDVAEGRKDLVLNMLQEAETFYREHVEPVQVEATEYYLAKPFGNEEKGRSAVISTDVRDTVQAILPSMMRIMFGPERVVEFKPKGPEDVEVAEQQTDYVNLIFTEDNDGFMIIHGWLKDGFIRKLGVVKWDYEDTTRVETSDHTGLTEEQVAVLAQEGDVEILVVYPQETTTDPTAPLTVYDVRLTRRIRDGRIRVYNVPNDEFWFSPGARSLKDARLVAHVREMRADELVAMGIDPEIIDDVKGKSPARAAYGSPLADSRTIDEGAQSGEFEEQQDEATRPVEYAECYVLLEDDAEVQLRKVCIVGRQHVVFDEAVDERPFALFCPDPEPHTLIGQSLADYTMDIQLIKSFLLRGMFDSLNLTLHPRVEIVEGMVNLDDLLNPEVGGMVRVRQPGMLRELLHTFVGKEAMPALGYMDETKENRTGISKAAAGLDADSLQSSTKAAVAATITAAQQHIEMLARVFAETAMRPLFKGLLRCVVKNQEHARVVRLRGEFVQVDPRHWDADMDVAVNIALGAGTAEEKLQTLAFQLQQQMQLLQMPGQPLVGFAELRNTLAKITELSGWKRSEDFYKPFTAEQEAQMQQQQAQQPPPPDPTTQALQAQLQIESQKLQLQQSKQQADLRLEAQKMQMEDDRERDRMAREFALKQQELEMKYQTTLVEADLERRVAAEKHAMDLDAQRDLEVMRMESERDTAPPAPRRKRIRLERDENGRVATAEVEEQEG